MQLFSLIYSAQEIANAEGIKVEYITADQMSDLIPMFFKYNQTQTVEQIQSLTDIASKLHNDLTKG